jgi:hypothetical protein
MIGYTEVYASLPMQLNVTRLTRLLTPVSNRLIPRIS